MFVRTYSVELRELEAKLKAGYMNKERAAQLAEKDAIKKQEEVINLLHALADNYGRTVKLNGSQIGMQGASSIAVSTSVCELLKKSGCGNSA